MSEMGAHHFESHECVMDRFVRWARAQSPIEAAMVVGSRTRTDHPADAWSDLDIVVFATAPEILLANDAWLHNLGDPVITYVEPTAVGAWLERRVLFEGGHDVGFAVIPADQLNALDAIKRGDPLHAQIGATIGRGYRVLIDRNHRLTPSIRGITALAELEPVPPTQELIVQTINDFWYHCVCIAMKLRPAHRGIRERKGTLWHGTRSIEEWAPEEVTMRLAETSAEHHTESILCALTRMMDLVAWLMEEIANAYSLKETPVASQVAARRWVTEISTPPPPGSRTPNFPHGDGHPTGAPFR